MKEGPKDTKRERKRGKRRKLYENCSTISFISAKPPHLLNNMPSVCVCINSVSIYSII